MKVVHCDLPLTLVAPGFVLLESDMSIEYYDDKGVKHTLVIPEGTKSNFGSVPWFARWLVSGTDRELMIGSIPHDYLVGEFGNSVPQGWDWRKSAKLLRALMAYFTTPGPRHWWSRLKRELVYRGIMLHGIVKGRASV